MRSIRKVTGMLVILGICIVLMSVMEAQRAHTVYGYCFNATDGTSADGSDVTAYIQTRPNEKLFTVVGKWDEYLAPNIWVVNTDNFPTPWEVGETLIVDVDNGAGCTANTSVVLTGAGEDAAPNMTIVCPDASKVAHIVYGYVLNASDKTSPDGSNVTIYIETRPHEKIYDTVGVTGECKLANCWAQNTANFPTGWRIGETVIIEVKNSAGCTANTSVTLTNAGFDQSPNVTLVCPAPTCINLTDCVGGSNDCLINDSITLCKDVYNINDANKNGILRINASNIVLDCNGATLIGDGNGKGVNNKDNDNVTIKNCVVVNYEHGIYLYNTNDSTLLNNTVNSNYWCGIHLHSSSNNTVINNTANLNNEHGIYLYNFSYFNNLINNKITNNNSNNNSNNTGVYFDSNSNNNNLTSNFICGNRLDIQDDGANSGDNNTCGNTSGWNDAGTTGCNHKCAEGFNCDLNNDGIIAHDYNDLMTAYRCFLGINKNCDIIHFQDWTNMKNKYQCFTNI